MECKDVIFSLEIQTECFCLHDESFCSDAWYIGYKVEVEINFLDV